MLLHRELRRSPRVPMSRFVVCMRYGDLVVSGDVSSGGVGFDLDAPVGLGDPICVSLLLPETGEAVSMSAVVCHVEPRAPEAGRSEGSFHVGARFLDVDLLVASPLERHIEEAALAARLSTKNAVA